MKLRQKMLLVIIGSILVILAGMLSYIAISTKQMAEQSGESLATASGDGIASEIAAEMNEVMTSARTIAETLEGMKGKGNTDRDVVNAILKRILEDNPNFLGTWTVWEPNAFDGKDQLYAGSVGSDTTGRLNIYWTRTGSDLSVNPIYGYDQPGTGDFYLLPKNSGIETIINPYKYTIDGREVMLTSLSVPIHYNGKFVGVAGVDIALDSLQTRMNEFKLYDSGYASIFSNNGSVITSPSSSNVGKMLGELMQNEHTSSIVSAMQKGASYTAEINGMYKHYVPIQIGRAATPWSVEITIPTNEIHAKSNQMLYSNIITGVIALLLLAGVVYVITLTIVKPITVAVSIGEMMAEGDFTKQIPPTYLKRKDEIGTLVKVFDHLSKSMKTMIGQVSMNASQVAAGAQQISASAEELASGNNNQAEAAQTMNELFKELSIAIDSVAKSAEQAAELSTQTSKVASEGSVVVNQSIEGMNRAKLQMAKLEEDSNRIGDIIEVIDDIAEQTNLLALNAAIEAARAGEQGRGFAVVADEVRKLAERSGEATKQITSIIKGMQVSTHQSVKAVEEGVQSSAKTGEAFKSIASMVDEAAHKVTEIAAASEQQAAQSTEVLSAIENISATTEEVAASSQETAATAQSLAKLADELNNSVSAFKI
jgi:methyl-accepting chemotaxis protein